VLSTITLTNAVGLKSGDVADGMAIEGAWDRVREEYGRRGYMQTKVDPQATYDDAAHTVAYHVHIEEGKTFHLGSVVVTGLSLNAEKHLREAWPFHKGNL